MANAVRYGQRIGQNWNPDLFYRGFSEVTKLTYEDGSAGHIGSLLWAKSNAPNNGVYFEEMYYTGLIGHAQKTLNYEEPAPRVGYMTTSAVYGQFAKYHIAYEFLKEMVNDEIHSLTPGMVADLGTLLAETEENVRLAPIINGETFVSGWQRKPLFANNLGIIAADNFSMSNILLTAGGPSYATWAKIYEYGQNFVTQENRNAPIQPVKILTGWEMAHHLNILFDAPSNIERSNPNVPNPVKGFTKPEIIVSNRLPDPTMIVVYYTGWEKEMMELDQYRGEDYAYTKDEPEAMVHIKRTKTLNYFRDQRRIVMIPGLEY